MINHFRTLLLNISDQGEFSDHIAKGFAARQLPSDLQNIYNILFPPDSSKQTKLDLAQAYCELVVAAGLDEAFTLVDSRLTYDLKTDLNRFKSPSVNIANLDSRLTAAIPSINRMLSRPKVVDTSKYDNMYKLHPNTIYRIAALIVAYVLRLS